MRLLAAAMTGVAVALVVGWLTGGWPPPRLRRAGRSRSLWLIQTGMGLSRAQFFGLAAGVGLVAFLLVWSVSGLMVIALPAALISALLPRAWLQRRRAQRLAEMHRAWPDGLRDLTASISAGMSLARALEKLSSSGPAPLRNAFARFPYLSRALGVPVALEAIKEELAHPVSDRILEVLIVAHLKGGPVVLDILRDLTVSTTRDMWAGEEIETLALEQKINARAVFVIPWLVLAFITVRPGPFRDFYSSAAGWLVVAVGAAASGLGMAIASRLGRDLEEPRVFGEARA
ncbi:MAG: type II secretion system F family protein [Actinomycetota bacterium]